MAEQEVLGVISSIKATIELERIIGMNYFGTLGPDWTLITIDQLQTRENIPMGAQRGTGHWRENA